VSVINQQAARVCREDILNSMAKTVPEFFKDDTKHQKQILARSEAMCLEKEEAFLESKCSTYDFPNFEIQQHEFE